GVNSRAAPPRARVSTRSVVSRASSPRHRILTSVGTTRFLTPGMASSGKRNSLLNPSISSACEPEVKRIGNSPDGEAALYPSAWKTAAIFCAFSSGSPTQRIVRPGTAMRTLRRLTARTCVPCHPTEPGLPKGVFLLGALLSPEPLVDLAGNSQRAAFLLSFDSDAAMRNYSSP